MNRAARIAANLEVDRFLTLSGIDLQRDIASRHVFTVKVKIVTCFADITVFRGSGIACPVAMAHRLMNMAQRNIANFFLQRLEIGQGKSATFSNEIIRPRMQQKNVVLIGFQSRHELADLERCRGTKVARSTKRTSSNSIQEPDFRSGSQALRSGPVESKGVLSRINKSSSAKNCIQVGSSE